jgi:4-amino-4-deoxy-L-arabinose transferase-like glycosyltransferase
MILYPVSYSIASKQRKRGCSFAVRDIGLNSLIAWFKSGFNKWRLAFLGFAIVYFLFLVFGVYQMFGLAHMSPQWDEVTNLNGGLMLLRGNFQQYLSWNSFYPPMYDLFTAGFFAVGGVSVFMGRFVSVVFSLLSVYAVFEFTYRIYGAKTGLLASILLAVMPGYVWLSRMAMIEPMLVFFFTVSTLFFFLWLKEHKNKFLALTIVTFAVGVATKYQTVIVAVIAVVGLAVLGRDYLKMKFRTVSRLTLTVVAVVVPLVVVFYLLYTAGLLNQWLYAMNIGNPDKTLYSTGLDRFPAWFDPLPSWIRLSIFYLIEITEPYTNVHPISFLLYAVGLVGLGWLAVRHKAEDKYLLIWFVVVYIFFTAIPNRQWRYLIPVFPVLAISGAFLIISALEKSQKTWKLPHVSVSKKRLVQVAAGALIAFTLVGFYYSVNDAYSWVAKDQIYVPLQQATDYVAIQLNPGESVMVLCPFNLIDQSMVWLYLNAKTSVNTQVYQYPEDPVDTYTPNFNMTVLVSECVAYNIKYLIVDEYGGSTYHYFGTTLNFEDFNQTLMSTGNFTYEPVTFWVAPARIFILTFS